jgi:hypothetical protein
MKKIAFVVFLVCVTAASVFAQNYTVESVTGRVQRESSGRMVDVRVGDILTEDTVIRIPARASIVLKEGDEIITISDVGNGKLSELLAGVGIAGGNVSRTDTGAVSRTTGQVSTASARASVAVRGPNGEDEEEEEDSE